MIRRVVVSGTLGLVAMALGGCSSDFDDAMAKGCEGLRSSAQAYAAGDRQGVEDAKDGAEYLGMASELADDRGVDEDQRADASDAHIAFNALFSAAYEETNNGNLVWRGKKLNAQRERTLETGLDACHDY
jgi:hypothetical protein